MIFLPPGPVHVIVDQVPVVQGHSIWFTTTVSAVVGAAFAVLTNSLMEIVKPAMQRFFLKRRMRPQLVSEFKGNFRRVKVIVGDRTQPPDDEILAHAAYFTITIDKSKFQHYLERETIALYEVDSRKQLQTFYDCLTIQVPHLRELAKAGEVATSSVWSVILNAATFGEMFLDSEKESRDE
jgi:hypothetical protein